jgi:hypothetical protein
MWSQHSGSWGRSINLRTPGPGETLSQKTITTKTKKLFLVFATCSFEVICVIIILFPGSKITLKYCQSLWQGKKKSGKEQLGYEASALIQYPSLQLILVSSWYKLPHDCRVFSRKEKAILQCAQKENEYFWMAATKRLVISYFLWVSRN